MKSESEMQESPKPSILAALANARVMTLKKIDSGRFVLTEGCDGYFEMELSGDELIALADELRSIAAGSPPSPNS